MGAADDVNEDQRVEGDEGGGAQGVDPPGGREPGDEERGAEHRRAAMPSRGDGGVDREPGER